MRSEFRVQALAGALVILNKQAKAWTLNSQFFLKRF